MVKTLLSMQGAQVQSLVEGLRSCMHGQNKVSSHWGKTKQVYPPFLKNIFGCAGPSLVWGLFSGYREQGLLIVLAFLVAEHRLYGSGLSSYSAWAQ